jgi:hypothetical protein
VTRRSWQAGVSVTLALALAEVISNSIHLVFNSQLDWLEVDREISTRERDMLATFREVCRVYLLTSWGMMVDMASSTRVVAKVISVRGELWGMVMNRRVLMDHHRINNVLMVGLVLSMDRAHTNVIFLTMNGRVSIDKMLTIRILMEILGTLIKATMRVGRAIISIKVITAGITAKVLFVTRIIDHTMPIEPLISPRWNPSNQ